MSAPSVEKKPNMVNHGGTKGDSARWRDEDAEKIHSSQMLGVIELLRNPRNRLYLATLVAITLFLVPFNFYVSQFSVYGQFSIGILCGLFLQGVYFLYCLHRTHQRRRKSVQIAQLATLDRDQLRVLLSEKLFPTWVSFIDYEKTDWLNRILIKLWPHMNQVAEDLIKETVQPILDQYAMGIIQKITLRSIRFGRKAPIITGVRFVPGGLEDETVLEIKFNWQAVKDRVILSVDFPGPDHHVKLKKWHLIGTAKLTFKPLTGTIPGFGAVLVSLTEVPDFDFVLKFLGENFTTLPGVGKMIDNSIRIALMDSLIWPSRIVVPIIPGDFSFLELHPMGELEVTLIDAKIIKSARHICKADPFVFLYVRHTNNKTKRSQSRHSTLKPVWNEVFRIEVEDPEYQKLTLKLMHDKSVGVAECIGAAELPIKEFKAHHKTERWCEVLDCTLQSKGHHKSERWSRVSERWSGVLDSDPDSPTGVQSPRNDARGSLHLIVTWYPYTREQILEKRGHNETEEMIYKERMILASEKILGAHK